MTITPITEAREAELLDMIALGTKGYRKELLASGQYFEIIEHLGETDRGWEFSREYNRAIHSTKGQRERAAACLKVEARWSRELTR